MILMSSSDKGFENLSCIFSTQYHLGTNVDSERKEGWLDKQRDTVKRNVVKPLKYGGIRGWTFILWERKRSYLSI